MSIGLLSAALLLIAAVLAWRRHRAGRRPPGTEPWMPRALWGAELAYAERTFRSRRRHLVARVDRAYRLGSQIVLVELKTRHADEVFDSDLIELSVQKAALEDDTGEAVSPRAWVLVEDPRSGWRSPHAVELLDDAALAALADRYRRLRAGRLRQPQAAATPAMCRHCGHFTRCQKTYGDRT